MRQIVTKFTAVVIFLSPLGASASECTLAFHRLEPRAGWSGSIGQFPIIGVAESVDPFQETAEPVSSPEDCRARALHKVNQMGFPTYAVWGIGTEEMGMVDAKSFLEYDTGDDRFYLPGMFIPKNCGACYFFYYMNEGHTVSDEPSGSSVARNEEECVRQVQKAYLQLGADQSAIDGAHLVWGAGLSIMLNMSDLDLSTDQTFLNLN